MQTAAYIADRRPRVALLAVLAAGLWAGAWLVHLATLRQIAPDEITWRTSRASASTSGSRARFSSAMPAALPAAARGVAPGVRGMLGR
ncbi:MAG: hypothetical protein U0Z44_05970 [Kouleothrix sp.]